MAAETVPGEISLLAAGKIPVRIRRHSPRVLRISLGTRPADAASSYVGAGPADESGPARAEAGGIRVAAYGTTVTIGAPDGRDWLRLSLESLQLEPRVRLRLEIAGLQHFYGLGEGGPQFDRLGTVRRLWNFQSSRAQGADIAIPLLLSNAGYGLFIDNSAQATLAPGDSNDGMWLDYSGEGGGFDLYLFGGGGLRGVLEDFAALIGRATMPPRWALGYLQSTRHFESTEEVLGLARSFRDKRIPCDAIIFLSTYGQAQGLNSGVGHLAFHPALFADPAATLGELRDAHFRVFSHEYPVLHRLSPLFPEAEREGFLLDYGYPEKATSGQNAVAYKEGQLYLDFSRPEVRSWWWKHHQELRECGIEGWWLDGGEGPPADVSLHAGPATVLHNRFDLLRQQAFAEGEARDRPKTRPFLLCRSGGPGMQRFGAVPWSGDINTTFETFETQIRTGLNLALSGVPHWGTDIGGFFNVITDEGELFVRWLQFGAFCSLFRAHGHLWRRHLPWAYGGEIEAICRRYIELRSRLMPYTYTLAWQARQNGLPTMRPLVLNYPDDARVWDLGTQYLWGDDLLVAPVTRQGATSWTVYLPEGRWHDFWTGEVYEGPAGVTVAAPLERLPLFVRGGAILPMGPVMQYAGEQPLTELTVLVYPEGRSGFVLYEDDGETNDYLGGRYALTELSCEADAATVSCRVSPQRGGAAVIPEARRYVFRIRAASEPRRVELEAGGTVPQGEGASAPTWWWDREGFVVVRLPPGPNGVRLHW
ncbi:TIM-barrel domain-containing protein [Bosea sp. BK604]|uniref:glycoside hydrolase family 31 protein n=1 Tax=Bosea sp. BK604 TaxID=2512180 RepID=UPI00104C2211|nr:TIM-barrel domain-containing protein [Bosea sp. BK604]TCR65350.1 alpha-glucosidase [Bosea sp. BK604]